MLIREKNNQDTVYYEKDCNVIMFVAVRMEYITGSAGKRTRDKEIPEAGYQKGYPCHREAVAAYLYGFDLRC